ncbi:hypothetical protein BB558_002899, partial [Smittium angustum]
HLIKIARNEAEMAQKLLELEIQNKDQNAKKDTRLIPLPEFDGSPLEFDGWIKDIEEVSSFERKFIVINSLTKSAKEWQKSLPNSEIATWELLIKALKIKYKNEFTYMEANKIVRETILTTETNYVDFITKVRPAVTLLSKGDSELGISILLMSIEEKIKMFLPVTSGENIMFENKRTEEEGMEWTKATRTTNSNERAEIKDFSENSTILAARGIGNKGYQNNTEILIHKTIIGLMIGKMDTKMILDKAEFAVITVE